MSGPWKTPRCVVSRAGQGLFAVLLSVLLVTSFGPAVFAGQPGPRGEVGHAGQRVAGGGREISHRVTLITGDTVTFAERAGGQAVVSIDAAPRSGPQPVFYTRTGPGGLDVIPSDAEPLLASGAVDRELFDVSELVKQGLADESSDELPLIVGYRNEPSARVLAQRAGTLPGSKVTVTLPTIDAAAVRVDRAETNAFWRALASDRRTLTGGVSTLHLDGKVKASLDESAPQIGAPEAWKAGLDGSGVTVAVLDTGIDAQHPDLVGRIADARNFTEDPDVSDGYGHGTHVASIIAGSGAADRGRYRGIASGARLLNGKVLDNTGSGDESQLMAGMEWAAHAGAKVVNMSLGAGPSDGSDLVSEMVDKLSVETGALFVAAAGNSGEVAAVETPATAEAALAVGAVDKSDRMASFSSRGPRPEDAAVKPEIVAPGVNIVAAHAAGTDIGEPVGKSYTRLSGTSMATPHVAGAAALLAEKHPQWRARELKDSLASSAVDVGAAWYEEGAGRVDIPRALHNTVLAPSAVSFGRLRHPDGQHPVRRPVTYTNLTDHDVTLSLAEFVTSWDGRDAPSGAVRLDKDRVVVPASGKVTVTVTVDPTVGPSGPYGGLITATDTAGGTRTRTPISYYDEPERVPLTVRLTDSQGRAPTPRSLTIIRDDYDWANPAGNDPFLPESFEVTVTGGTGTIEVPKGVYSLTTTITEQAAAGRRATLLTAAETPVNGPHTISLDARTAVPVRVETGERVETKEQFAAVHRVLPGAPTAFVSGVLMPEGGHQVYITPTPAARRGSVGSQNYVTLAQANDDTKQMYNLYFRERNGIRSTHVDKVDPTTLVAIPTRYHADKPDIVFRKRWFALPTDVPSSIALSGTQFQGPAQWTEYIGPVDEKVEWKRYVTQATPRPDGRPDVRTAFSLISDDVFATPGPRPEQRWFQAPLHGGAAPPTTGGIPLLCSFCRSDKGEFVPAAQWMDSTPGHFAEPWQSGRYLSKVRLRKGNTEIPGVTRPGMPIPVFQLRQGTGRYELTIDHTVPEQPVPGWPSQAIQRLAPRITTVATFSSAPPRTTVPRGYSCLDEGSRCAFQPVITLDYQLGLDLLNQAPAGGTHTFTVSAAHQEGAESAGRIVGLRLWYSTDDGARWRRTEVVREADGRFSIRIAHPPFAQTNGFVSLRTEAWDDAGNRLNQTVRRAYALTGEPLR